MAADLQGKVVQRIFAAGLSLNGAEAMSADPGVRLVQASVADLDDAIRLLRQAVFGIEHRVVSTGLRQRVLDLCAGLSPVPEITFAGAVDEDVPAAAGDQLLGVLPLAFAALGPQSTQTSIVIEASERLCITVTGNGGSRDLTVLRDMAGTRIEVEPSADGIRLVWSVPVTLR